LVSLVKPRQTKGIKQEPSNNECLNWWKIQAEMKSHIKIILTVGIDEEEGNTNGN